MKVKVMAAALFVILLSQGMYLWAQHVVKVKEEAVGENAVIDYNDDANDIVTVVEVKPEGSSFRHTSAVLQAPPNFSFKPFLPGSPDLHSPPIEGHNPNGNFIDIVTNPDSNLLKIVTQGASGIQFEGVYTETTAATFPMRADGNLEPETGGIGGTPQEYHWSVRANTTEARILLELHDQGSGDDYIIWGSTAPLTVTVLGGDAATTYTVDLSCSPNGGDATLSVTQVLLQGQGGSTQITAAGTVLGKLSIDAECSNAKDYSLPCEVIPAIEKLQFALPGGTFQDFPENGLYVKRGTTVQLKALPYPSEGTWPDGLPQWSGSFGATGTGGVVSVTSTASSSSMTDKYSIIASLAGIQEATEEAISWENQATLIIDWAANDPGQLEAKAEYKCWCPDTNGDGMPDSSGGSVILSLMDYDDFTDTTLHERATWSFSNGVTRAQTYVIVSGVNYEENTEYAGPASSPDNTPLVNPDPNWEPQPYYSLGVNRDDASTLAGGVGAAATVLGGQILSEAGTEVVRQLLADYLEKANRIDEVRIGPENGMAIKKLNHFLDPLTVQQLSIQQITTATAHRPNWSHKYIYQPGTTVLAMCNGDKAQYPTANQTLDFRLTQMVAFVWGNPLDFHNHQGWARTDMIVASYLMPGRSRVIRDKPSHTHSAAFWFNFPAPGPSYKCTKGVCGFTGELVIHDTFFPGGTDVNQVDVKQKVTWPGLP